MASWTHFIGAVSNATDVRDFVRWQSALNTHSPQSSEIKFLLFIFIALAALIWTAVMIAVLIAVLQRAHHHGDPLQVELNREHRAGAVIFSLSCLTVVLVLGLSFVSYSAQRSIFTDGGSGPLIRIIGHQWWWEVQYQGSPSEVFTTANEIRVPIGEPVTVQLETRDVIHSFWVPSLMGKMDLINGQQNQLQFTASHAGVYRGQCAEFCGLQHAHMAFEVVALSSSEYAKWRAGQIARAQPPADPEARDGQRLFSARGCALCHTIRGTSAGGRVGPDLTHLASRRTIAAARLPMTIGNLAGWIADPQHVKPGNLMPRVPLDGNELIAVTHYLGGLK
jgi:cytochrome c oxidase subunit 2